MNYPKPVFFFNSTIFTFKNDKRGYFLSICLHSQDNEQK